MKLDILRDDTLLFHYPPSTIPILKSIDMENDVVRVNVDGLWYIVSEWTDIDSENSENKASIKMECDRAGVIVALRSLHQVLISFLGSLDDDTTLTSAKGASTIARIVNFVFHGGNRSFEVVSLEPEIVKGFVAPGSFLDRIADLGLSLNTFTPISSFGARPYRKAGIRHTNSEVYIDVREQVDCFISLQSKRVSLARVHGIVSCKAILTGASPRISLAIERPSQSGPLTVSTLHNAVDDSRIGLNGNVLLEYVPPDNTLFELCTYFTDLKIPKTNFAGNRSLLPFTIDLRYLDSELRRFEIKVRSHRAMDKLTIKIPVKIPMRGCTAQESRGLFVFESNTISWELGRISNGITANLTGELSSSIALPAEPQNPASHIEADFVCSGFSITGISISHLEIRAQSEAKPYKGVKYSTESRNVVIRL